ncbi:hypothetical protein LX32DRAFT_15960 [Colletotrichum zoysiae]|uniref:Uncharacterized protein n=1 Tax=Colletotrichum zoysiae TaxID=1216348 RepID=A0AAD9HET5_9PEZI|nr:hypothetical protein LX32DRAFT_15960 [Colletotrichum zoysiae]
MQPSTLKRGREEDASCRALFSDWPKCNARVRARAQSGAALHTSQHSPGRHSTCPKSTGAAAYPHGPPRRLSRFGTNPFPYSSYGKKERKNERNKVKRAANLQHGPGNHPAEPPARRHQDPRVRSLAVSDPPAADAAAGIGDISLGSAGTPSFRDTC